MNNAVMELLVNTFGATEVTRCEVEHLDGFTYNPDEDELLGEL